MPAIWLWRQPVRRMGLVSLFGSDGGVVRGHTVRGRRVRRSRTRSIGRGGREPVDPARGVGRAATRGVPGGGRRQQRCLGGQLTDRAAGTTGVVGGAGHRGRTRRGRGGRLGGRGGDVVVGVLVDVHGDGGVFGPARRRGRSRAVFRCGRGGFRVCRGRRRLVGDGLARRDLLGGARDGPGGGLAGGHLPHGLLTPDVGLQHGLGGGPAERGH